MNGHVIDLTGQLFGRLTVLSRAADYISPRGKRVVSWLVRCDCGGEKVIHGKSLKQGKANSCGCDSQRLKSVSLTKHGMNATPEYRIWSGMKQRCENPKAAYFHCYGGRGVRVCEEWRRDFMAFYRDVGQRPTPEHSIDRIDVNGHYEPDNVRWATPAEQSANRRDAVLATPQDAANYYAQGLTVGQVAVRLGCGHGTAQQLLVDAGVALGRQGAKPRIVTFRGETGALSMFCKRLGIGYMTVHGRLQRGMSVEDALTTPTR